MMPSFLRHLVFVTITTFVGAQSGGSGYSGYSLSRSGDAGSIGYNNDSSVAGQGPVPDVYLNASVSVGEIGITVDNLTAKINLDAQVLKLLQFNAGVALSIDRVSLLIQDVKAEVLLEARLGNLVRMIDDTLNSIDLNPILATVGQVVGSIVNTTVGSLTGNTPLTPRSYQVDNHENDLLYSINDYDGKPHTHRVLTRSGTIIDQFLDQLGHIDHQQVVGSYLSVMTFNGYNESVVVNGQDVYELGYVYAAFDGLGVVSFIYVDAAGVVVSAQVVP